MDTLAQLIVRNGFPGFIHALEITVGHRPVFMTNQGVSHRIGHGKSKSGRVAGI